MTWKDDGNCSWNLVNQEISKKKRETSVGSDNVIPMKEYNYF
jgi:hypothetical protein